MGTYDDVRGNRKPMIDRVNGKEVANIQIQIGMNTTFEDLVHGQLAAVTNGSARLDEFFLWLNAVDKVVHKYMDGDFKYGSKGIER